MTEHIIALLSRTEIWVGGLGLAGFLVLFWTLRGAPIGQGVLGESDEAPRGGYRDRVIASVVIGLLLIVTGGYVAVAHGVRWSLIPFTLGFGIVLTLITVNRRYRHGSPTLRRTMDLANAALTASLLAGVLIVGNVLAFRYGGRPLDFTREHAFSLSDITVKQLRALSRPLTFTVFFGASDRAVLQHDRVKQLLERYQAENPERIKIEYLNPYQDLEKFNTLAKRVPEIAVSLSGGGILIEDGSGDSVEHVVIRNNDLFELPQRARTAGNGATFETTFKGEDAVTSALVRLREGKKVKVAFTAGHGETPPDEPDVRKPGLASFKSRLSALGSEVIELNLSHGEIPDDLALLMIVAPKTPFKPEELAKIRAFASRGGPLLLLVGNQNPSGLDELLKAHNLALGKGIVVDPVLNWNRIIGQVEVPVSNLTRQPIVDSLAGRFVLFPYPVASLKIAPPGAAANPSVTAFPILRTGKEAWAETDLKNRPVKDKDDEPGPFIVAAVVYDRPAPGSREPEGKPRMVVVSCASVADNLILDYEQTNLDFLMNAVSWLRGRSDLIGIKPNQHIALTLTADSVLRGRLILVPTVAAVLLILGLGATTYVARRE